MTRLQKILSKIDEYNAIDPTLEFVEGKNLASELIYGQRMSEMLGLLKSEPSEALSIAARAQHIQRWKIPRSSYDATREGYLRWRNDLKKMHASIISEILIGFFCEQELIDRVVFLIQKKDYKRDLDSQCIEDAACLVFLNYYLEKFATKTDHTKMVDILKKSWAKMSEDAHKLALGFQYNEDCKALIKEALNG